jgi:thiamine-monophosphate kinase
MSSKRTEISELGEFGLIDHLNKQVNLKNSSRLKGIGDDAAVIDAGDHVKVVSTDLLLEGVHFRLGLCPTSPCGVQSRRGQCF